MHYINKNSLQQNPINLRLLPKLASRLLQPHMDNKQNMQVYTVLCYTERVLPKPQIIGVFFTPLYFLHLGVFLLLSVLNRKSAILLSEVNLKNVCGACLRIFSLTLGQIRFI